MDNTICYKDYFLALRPRLGEREFRLVSSALAMNLPRGGVSLVAAMSGLSRITIYSGIRELENDTPVTSSPARQRKDGGGSNGSRNRLWKAPLQKFADEACLNICVCHFPPGTSKWNKIEHRMFSVISMNWRGRPLTSVEVIVSLIAATTTTTLLKIKAEQSSSEYVCGKKVRLRALGLRNVKR